MQLDFEDFRFVLLRHKAFVVGIEYGLTGLYLWVKYSLEQDGD